MKENAKSKTVTAEIAGKIYPMRFSIAATKAIAERFGAVEKIADVLSGGLTADAVDQILWLVELLIGQGCIYKNLFEQGIPAPKGAAVDKDGIWQPIDAETLSYAIDASDLSEITNKILAAFGAAQGREVVTEDEGKN